MRGKRGGAAAEGIDAAWLVLQLSEVGAAKGRESGLRGFSPVQPFFFASRITGLPSYFFP